MYRILIAFFAACCNLQAQSAPEKSSDQAHDDVTWKWAKDPTWEDYSAKVDSTKYNVTYEEKKDGYAGVFKLHRLNEQKPIATWTGHSKSCFFLKDDTLVYLDYSQISMGGSLRAMSITSGKKLWEANLNQIWPAAHSKWSNRANIEERDGNVFVYSKQSARFVWVFRAEDGLLLAHAFYYDAPKKNPQEAPKPTAN